jgi:mannose-6-phosphate isomerase
MSELYPLKFKPILKEKIWGGQKIKSLLNKNVGSTEKCGETWELSGVPGDVSVVAEGPLKGRELNEVLTKYQHELVGERVFKQYSDQFPLLVKFIDANEDLSVQVHPNDELAQERHDSFGKTEMWYILQADEDATLNSGFNRPLTREQYLEYFNAGKLMDILHVEKVAADDVYFLPAGRVHYIGRGCLLAEIQQSSDITYRMYDFDRKDDQGMERELHVEESLDAIDFSYYDKYKTPYVSNMNQIVPLVSCKYFTTNKLHYNEVLVRDHSMLDSFVIYVCLHGALSMDYGRGKIEMATGDVVLVPAAIETLTLTPNGTFKVLESYVE